MIFLITWTGGYELPDYFVSKNRDEAMEKFADWGNQLAPDAGEIIQALVIYPEGVIELLESYTAEDKEGSIF